MYKYRHYAEHELSLLMPLPPPQSTQWHTLCNIQNFLNTHIHSILVFIKVYTYTHTHACMPHIHSVLKLCRKDALQTKRVQSILDFRFFLKEERQLQTCRKNLRVPDLSCLILERSVSSRFKVTFGDNSFEGWYNGRCEVVLKSREEENCPSAWNSESKWSVAIL